MNKVQNPFASFDNQPDEFVDEATLGIYEYIHNELDDREPKLGGGNRASASGSCPRKVWFQNQGLKGELMAPRAILNFTLGDVTEAVVTSFIKSALVGSLYKSVDFGEKIGEVMIQNRLIEAYSQETVTTTIPASFGDISIPGHADGWGELQDGSWELIEIKSASSYGFQEFEKNGPGDYIYQAHCLMMSDKAQSLGVKRVRFFYIKKDTGHLATGVFPYEESVAQEVRRSFIKANQEEMPCRGCQVEDETVRKKLTGRKKLHWKGAYCGFKDKCYELEKSFQSSFGTMKPVFYVKRVKDDSENEID